MKKLSTIKLIKNSNHDILSTLKAPDFSTGGFLLYYENEIKKIYETGKGSFKVRAKYTYDKSNNCLEIIEIPPSTTIESIIDKVIVRTPVSFSFVLSNGMEFAIDGRKYNDGRKYKTREF